METLWADRNLSRHMSNLQISVSVCMTRTFHMRDGVNITYAHHQKVTCDLCISSKGHNTVFPKSQTIFDWTPPQGINVPSSTTKRKLTYWFLLLLLLTAFQPHWIISHRNNNKIHGSSKGLNWDLLFVKSVSFPQWVMISSGHGCPLCIAIVGVWKLGMERLQFPTGTCIMIGWSTLHSDLELGNANTG